VRVDDQKGAENRVGERVQRSSREGGNGQGNQTSGDDPLEAPVVAAVGVVGVWHWDWVVGGSDDLLGQRRQDLVALGSVEGGNARGLLDGGALECRAKLLDERAVHGRCRSGQHALRLLDWRARLPEETGTHDGGHCVLEVGGRGRGGRCDAISERLGC
jgi:hypothetical protein